MSNRIAAIEKRLERLFPLGVEHVGGLTFVNLGGESPGTFPYRPLRDPDPEVRITEVSDAGSVETVRIVSGSDSPVYIMDGSTLEGAKQHRMLNIDILVGPRRTIDVPVSCVESGRWGFQRSGRSSRAGQPESQAFKARGAASYGMRRGKQERMLRSLKGGMGFDAQQSAVWTDVEKVLAATGAGHSPTRALRDAYEVRKSQRAQLINSVATAPGAVGLLVLDGLEFLGVDVFDKAATFRHYRRRILDSYAIELMQEQRAPIASEQDPAITLDLLRHHIGRGSWSQFRSPGIGQDCRLESPDLRGSALVADDQVPVHIQIFPSENNHV